MEIIKRKSKYLEKTFYFRKDDLERAARLGHACVKSCKKSGAYYSEDYKDAPIRLVHLGNLDPESCTA